MRDEGGTLEAGSRIDPSNAGNNCVLRRPEDLPAGKEERYFVALLLEVFYNGSFIGIRRAELPNSMQRQNAAYTERAGVEKALLNAIIETG